MTETQLQDLLDLTIPIEATNTNTEEAKKALQDFINSNTDNYVPA